MVTDIEQLLEAHDFSESRYYEFLRKSSMSAGIYRLPRNGIDLQKPHTEDEIYFVLSGKARFQINDQHYAVNQGFVIFVAAMEPHRFYDIDEELTVLVFFAPAESQMKQE